VCLGCDQIEERCICVPSSANDRQEGGEHYRSEGVQCWDYIASNGIGYLEGNVIKYVSRHKAKGGVEDLKKARHYLDKLIELESTKGSKAGA
jgi:hypothetical protein